MNKLLFVLAATLCASPALAAGINSHAYSCGELHALVAARGFVFIGNPDFQDFVVSRAQGCGGDYYIQVRSVPTSDDPECPVNYCIPSNGPGGG